MVVMGRREKRRQQRKKPTAGADGDVARAPQAVTHTTSTSPSQHTPQGRSSTRGVHGSTGKRGRSATDGSVSSSSSENDMEHAAALGALRNLDAVRHALESALGDLQRVGNGQETMLAAGNDDFDALVDAAVAQRRIKALRASVVEAVDRGVAEMGDVMGSSLQKLAHDIKRCVGDRELLSPKKRATLRRRRLFSEKVFKSRASLLSNMLRDRDFQTLYNISAAGLLWLGIMLYVEEVSSGALFPDLSMLLWSFSSANVVIAAWWAMFTCAFGVVWLVQRCKANSGVSIPLVLAYGAIQCTIVTVGFVAALRFTLPPASGFIVMCESVRMFMKVHGYAREKLLHGLGDNKCVCMSVRACKCVRACGLLCLFVGFVAVCGTR